MRSSHLQQDHGPSAFPFHFENVNLGNGPAQLRQLGMILGMVLGAVLLVLYWPPPPVQQLLEQSKQRLAHKIALDLALVAVNGTVFNGTQTLWAPYLLA
jgi:hypothetical protein